MLGSISDFFAVWMWLVLIILIIAAGIAAAVKVHSVTKERIYENSVNSYLSGTKKRTPKISGKYKNMDGYTYENHVAKRLRSMGYRDVKITKKSGDFGADILAKDWKGSKICFQCKRYNGPVGVKAVQEAISAKTYYKCSKAAVITPSVFTEGAKKLAETSDVKLYECFK
ncbi:MAG: restriction endonuclease [Firmicutes bacterium]|nr:restriction endonuclease [Bacillota bacterium]